MRTYILYCIYPLQSPKAVKCPTRLTTVPQEPVRAVTSLGEQANQLRAQVSVIPFLRGDLIDPTIN